MGWHFGIYINIKVYSMGVEYLHFCLCYLVFFSCFFILPFSFAECLGIGRANSPGKANLVLCARTAHQDVLVGNT